MDEFFLVDHASLLEAPRTGALRYIALKRVFFESR